MNSSMMIEPPKQTGEVEADWIPLPDQPPVDAVSLREMTDDERKAVATADELTAQFAADWKAYEDARRRQRDNRPRPGDALLFAKVGQRRDIDPAILETEYARLSKIDRLLSQAGSLKDIETAREEFQSANATLEKVDRTVSARISKLEQQIAELRGELREAAERRDSALVSLDGMTKAREALRVNDILPPAIRDEISTRKAFILADVRERRRMLVQEIDGLKLECQSVIETDDGEIVNEHMHRRRVQSIAADPARPGHAYWKSRVFSLAEYGGYKRWCADRLARLQQELGRLDNSVDERLEEIAGDLIGFYSNELE